MNLETLNTVCNSFLKESKKKPWSTRPLGWKKPKTIKKYWKTLTKKKERPFTECVKKLKKHMNNPEAFCGSVKSIVKKKQ